MNTFTFTICASKFPSKSHQILQYLKDQRRQRMLLYSQCKRGNLEGVKTALNAGLLDKMNCVEKLACVKAVLHRKNLALIETFLEHLDMGRYETMMGQFYENEGKGKVYKLHGTSQEFDDLIAFHSACVIEQPNRITIATNECVFNMLKLDRLKSEMNDLVVANKMEEYNNEIETARLKKEKNMQKKKKKGKKKGKSDSRALVSETKYGNEKVNGDGNENVRVKADLRRKISELELDEEKSKLALSAAVDQQNTSMAAIREKLVNAFETKGQLQEESRDIEDAIKSLVERKRCIQQKQEEVEKEVQELEKKREKLEESSAALIKQQKENLLKVQENLKNVRQELDLAEGRPSKNTDLENFIARQIEELRLELECPVCLEVSTKAPIFKCSEDHLVCRYCGDFHS